MPGTDLKIDPVTKDYVDDGKGSFATTTTAETKIAHQINGRRNQWAGDPEAGSEEYKIERKNSERTIRARADKVRDALRPLEAAGIISRAEVSVDRDERGRLVLVGTIHDEQHGELDITPFLPGGA